MDETQWTMEFKNTTYLPKELEKQNIKEADIFEKIKYFLKKEYNIVYSRSGYSSSIFGQTATLYFKLPIFNIEFFVSQNCSSDASLKQDMNEDQRLLLRQTIDMIEFNLKEFIYA